MPNLGWILLVIYISFLPLFFAVRTIRSRRKIFVIQCVFGVVVAIYGMWIFGTNSEASFLKILGLPLSAIMVISISFAALTIDKVFSVSMLKKWVYPILSGYFAVSIFILTLVLHWKGGSSTNILPVSMWYVVFLLLLIGGFGSSVIWKFNLTCFQIFLPVLFASVLLVLAEIHLVDTILASIESVKESFEGRANRFTESFLAGGTWALFYLFTYFYLNSRANKEHLKQNACADKLPKAGVVLVMSFFMSQFPEFEKLKKLLPMDFAFLNFLDHGLLALDLLVIPLFLITSGWPYIRSTLAATLAAFGVFGCSVLAISLSMGTPFSVDADKNVMEKGKQTITAVVSWNPENIKRAFARRIEVGKSYFEFANELGELKDVKNMVGEVYTYFTLLNGSTNNALLSADLIFERGTAKGYLRMVKNPTINWEVRQAELYDQGGHYFRIGR